jgi:hypothetical protein
MRAKRFEKLLERKRKLVEKATKSIEELAVLDQKLPLYMNANGDIDWNKLAKHVSEATSGR